MKGVHARHREVEPEEHLVLPRGDARRDVDAVPDGVAALVWLAEALAGQGQCIEPGWIVLSGGLTASVALQARGVAIAEYDGLGTIAVHCG